MSKEWNEAIDEAISKVSKWGQYHYDRKTDTLQESNITEEILKDLRKLKR